jgi:hypothetical protein
LATQDLNAVFFVHSRMIGRLSPGDDARAAAWIAMAHGLAGFGAHGPIIILSHSDADGLATAAILVRTLEGDGPKRITKGENADAQALHAASTMCVRR